VSGGKLRIALVSTVPPVVQWLAPALQDLGHEVAGVVAARRPPRESEPPPEVRPGFLLEVAAADLPVAFPATRLQVEPFLRALEPELVLCWGYPWKLPPEALAVPRLGCVNMHPALLPRHRGPMPLSWALREGDTAFGLTWHRMDAELDTGAILAQTTVPIEDDDVTIEQIGPRLGAAAFALLPEVLERVAAGDPGEPQPEEGASWAGYFGEDYTEVDWSRPARAIHDQVRAWALSFGMSPVAGPFAELDGERVRVLRTSLADPGGRARRVEAGDGSLWIVATEPAAPDS
jgi:methionyl-tRNA formyltransferase